MKVNEIFYSLQGEGRLSGTPSTFVRLCGCNLKCPFCDTKHEEGTEMSISDIVQEVSKNPAPLVTITGGEPGMCKELGALVDALHEANRVVQVETNGTYELPEQIDWVTCSPKVLKQLRVKNVKEYKFVFQHNGAEWIDKAKATVEVNDDVFFYLQPCDVQDKEKNAEIMQEVVEYIKQHPVFRLSLQTQKVLNVR